MQILRITSVVNKTGLSRTQLWRLESQSKFPKKVHLGCRAVGWVEGEVDRWIESAKEGALE